MITLYNTLTRQKEKFEPLEKGKVSMYVCGPTVYNYIHIGNARSTVAFDTIRKYFEFRGYKVNYVSNFTDVDDKIIDAAKALNTEPGDVADRFIQAFFEDTEALHVKHADVHPRVMNNISEIIAFIQALIEKDFAYSVDGDVYYRTRQFSDYGKLSKISIDDLESGASKRLEEGENTKKEDPLDFALWKASKNSEISWQSPWGQGRPGWHIECSVMANRYLGETIDIHAGGQDLQFPHHENEIAQSEAKHGHPFAKYWLHNGFVTMNDEKMSKSLGNFKLVHDLRKIYDPQVLRFFLATAHYRRPINFSEDAIHEARTNLSRITTALSNAQHRLESAQPHPVQKDEVFQLRWGDYKDQFIGHMDDDFQAQNAITVIYAMVKELNHYLESDQVSQKTICQAIQDLQEYLYIFGIEEVNQEELLDEEIEAMIEARNQARANKDFDQADAIRDELKDRGIILEDTPQGLRWRRAD